MSDELKSVKLLQFDGKHENFQAWIGRFRCCAAVQKFAAAIGTPAEPDFPPQESERTNDTQDQKDARKRNGNAACALTLLAAFVSNGLMQMVFAAQAGPFPNGLASKMAEALHKRLFIFHFDRPSGASQWNVQSALLLC